MKIMFSLFIICFSISSFAQKHTPLPHGMVFGTKPDTSEMINVSQTEAFMNKKTRISATIRGRVIKVTRQKGGWFELDAGKGKVIAAHFKNYNVTIPTNLKGKIVIAEGIAEKQLIADDLQHFAGDKIRGKKQQQVKTDPKRRLTFEVKGLMVD